MESFIPDWAPNIHPLIIHFPIVLWTLAVAFDLLHLLSPRKWLPLITITHYGLSAVGALAAYLSGKQAIDLVSVPMQGELTAGSHSDWALYTLAYFSIYAALRLFLFWKSWDKPRAVSTLLVIVGVAGMGLIIKTADMGGKLVYKYGVGIKK